MPRDRGEGKKTGVGGANCCCLYFLGKKQNPLSQLTIYDMWAAICTNPSNLPSLSPWLCKQGLTEWDTMECRPIYCL